MRKAGNLFFRSICIMFGAVMFYIIVAVVFLDHIGYAYKKFFLTGNVLLLGTGLFLFAGILAVLGRLKSVEEFLRIHTGKKILAVSALLFLFQVYVCYNAYFGTGWDVGRMLIPNARMIMEGRFQDLSNDYFSKYPNNIFLLFVFSIIMRLDQMFGMLDTAEGIMGLIAVQCFLSCVTGYLVFQVVRDAFKSYRAAWGAWLGFFVLLGTSPWLIIPYSDSFGLFLPILILRVYQLLENGRHRRMKWFLIMFAAYWGYRLKPQIVLIFIAIAVVEGVHFLACKEKLKILLHSGVWGMLICFFISSLLYGQIKKQTGLILDTEKAFGIPHYLMMGLNEKTNGAYFSEDVIFSEGFSTKEERTEANLQVAAERLRQYGPAGLGMHLLRKTLNNFGDGTFAWSQEGEFYRTVYGYKNTVASPIIRDILWSGGSYNGLFETVKQAVWLLIITLSAGMVFNKRASDKIYLTVMTALLGLILFQLLFEARARYLYTYVPLYLTAAVMGVRGWYNCIKRIRFRRQL